MFSLSQGKKIIISLCAGVVFFFGCAGVGSNSTKSQDSADRLSREVATFMQAMVDKNWNAAYPFFDNSFKKSVSKETFASFPRQIEIKAFTVESVEILPSGKEADVTITQDLSSRGFTFKGIKKTQHWLVQKGKWVVLEGPLASMSESQE